MRVLRLMLACVLAGCPVAEDIALPLLAADAEGNPDPNAPPEALNNYANDLDDRGEHERAVRFYDAALAKYAPGQVESRANCHYNRALALRRLEKWDAAVESYAASYELDPQAKIFANISVPLDAAGRYPEAVDWLTRGIAQHPDDLRIVETLAALHIEHRDHELARPHVVTSIALRERGFDRNDERALEQHRAWLAAHPAPTGR